jgi:hypothetical protein
VTLRIFLLAICDLAVAPAAQAAIHQYSYDPADTATRQAAGGVTFMVNQTLFGGTRVLKMRATEARATADLQRADPGILGRGGLTRVLGPEGSAHDLYRIEAADEGPSFVTALCPGSKRGWVALSPVRYGQDVQAVVIGDDPAGGPARACRKLAFTFRGEWRMPGGTPPSTEAIEAPAFPN